MRAFLSHKFDSRDQYSNEDSSIFLANWTQTIVLKSQLSSLWQTRRFAEGLGGHAEKLIA